MVKVNLFGITINHIIRRLGITITYYCAFMVLLAILFYNGYSNNRTSVFISTDKSSGTCATDPNSQYCCEVPQTVTGTFLVDTAGNWNTLSKFSVPNSMYGVTLVGLTYTTDQWSKVMNFITAQVKRIGEKSALRDYAWNLIAMCSYTAQVTISGSLKFYSTGDPGIIFNQQSYAAFGNADGTCSNYPITSFNPTTSVLTFTTTVTDYTGYCTSVMNPLAMGLSGHAQSMTTFIMPVYMSAITTALCVNLGMLPLGHLVNVAHDSQRLALLDAMVSAGTISSSVASATSSYYDDLYAPTQPIYCTTYSTYSSSPQCMVLIGSTLVYPVMTSVGFPSGTGATLSDLQTCTSESFARSGIAHYWCTQLMLNLGLVFYPLSQQQCSPQSANHRRLDTTDYQLSESGTANRPTLHSLAADQKQQQQQQQQRASDLSALRDQLRTGEGGSTDLSSEAYYGSGGGAVSYYSPTSNFTFTLTNPCIDNGIIFKLTKLAARKLHEDPVNGDLYISNRTFNALSQFNLQANQGQPGLSELCGGGAGADDLPAGCSLLAVLFVGGNDKATSPLYYQPQGLPAFYNTLYSETVLSSVTANPPTELIQSYYECVMTKWSAFFSATGLASSNTQLYMAISFAVFIYFSTKALNASNAADIKTKHEKNKSEELEKQRHRDNVNEVIEMMNALKKDVVNGNLANGQFCNLAAKSLVMAEQQVCADELLAKEVVFGGRCSSIELVIHSAEVNEIVDVEVQ